METNVMQDNLQVLIAEDDPVVRRFLQSSLTKWGFPVRTTSDGAETRQCLLADDRPKLAIVDWNMPKLDGIDVCRAVRERHSMSDVFILMLTARTEPDDLAAALDAGANDYMTKPFDGTELKARLTVGQRLVSPMMMSTQSSVAARATSAPNRGGYITPVFDPHELRFSCSFPATLLRQRDRECDSDIALLLWSHSYSYVCSYSHSSDSDIAYLLRLRFLYCQRIFLVRPISCF